MVIFYAIYIKVWRTDGSIILYACHRTSGMASSDTAGTKIHYVLYSVCITLIAIIIRNSYLFV